MVFVNYRKYVATVLLEIIQMAPAEPLSTDLPQIMDIFGKLVHDAGKFIFSIFLTQTICRFTCSIAKYKPAHVLDWHWRLLINY